VTPTVRPSRTWRLTRRGAIWLLLVLGVGALAASAPTWLRTTGSTPLDADVLVQVTGTSAAPGVGAGALVVIAGALALGLVGRVGRWFVLVVTVSSGIVIAVSATTILRDPTQAARSAVAEATGVTDMTSGITLTPWPAAALAAGLLVVLASVWAAVSSPSWGRVSARHEIARPASVQHDGAPVTGPREPDASRPHGETAADPHVAGAAGDEPDEQETWDSLTRGEDPTDR
jgi:hypothetical protein